MPLLWGSPSLIMPTRDIFMMLTPHMVKPVSVTRPSMPSLKVPGASTNSLPDDVGTMKSCTSL